MSYKVVVLSHEAPPKDEESEREQKIIARKLLIFTYLPLKIIVIFQFPRLAATGQIEKNPFLTAAISELQRIFQNPPHCTHTT